MARPVAEILDYLAERRIYVVLKGGVPMLRCHPDVPRECFEADAARIAGDIRERRVELLSQLADSIAVEDSHPPFGSRAWRDLPAEVRRRLTVARLHDLSVECSGVVTWSCLWTKRTGTVAPGKMPPEEATRAALSADPGGRWDWDPFAPCPPAFFGVASWVPSSGRTEVCSFNLPHARTPPGFRQKAKTLMPDEWVPGVDFHPYVPTKKERSKVWREMWRVEITYAEHEKY